jgi:pimeloyl-ACP methyl ester carboxylesterase
MTDNRATIVLVHGALTDASIWHPVIADLHQRGHAVLAPAMPMRSLAEDVAYLHSVLSTIQGPVVVAGHSYGGSIISDPDALTAAVRGLAFVAAFQQDSEETTGELNYRLPGSMLGPDTTTVHEYPGGADMYLRPEHFVEVYAHDVDPTICVAMAAAQRPINPQALNETFTGTASWRTLPSWTLVATADHSLPTETQRFMAERARSVVADVDSSHAVPVAHPEPTANIIDTAVRTTA